MHKNVSRPRMLADAAIAGAIAVWIMDRFDWYAFNHEDPLARRCTETVRPDGLDPAHALAAKAAQATGTTLKPAPPHQHPAGLAVHYAVPIILALLYDILRHRFPSVTKGGGALYGMGIFVLLDEIINPMLGLAARPSQYPRQRHVRELTAHIIYGFVINAVMHRLMGPHMSSNRHPSSTTTSRNDTETKRMRESTALPRDAKIALKANADPTPPRGPATIS